MTDIASGMEKMRLPQPHSSVQEDRIVGTRQLFRDSQTGCMRQAVARAYDKGLKRVVRIQAGVARTFLARWNRSLHSIRQLWRFLQRLLICMAHDDEIDDNTIIHKSN